MSITIYTYSNPYELQNEDYWAIIRNAFQLCVSQTMVNGLTDRYKDFYKGKLVTMNTFVNTLFKDWEGDSVQIAQRAAIDNVIDTMDLKTLASSEDEAENIHNSLKLNRSNLYDSIRIMAEIGMNPNEIRTTELTTEQKYVLEIYKRLLDSGKTQFSLKRSFAKSEVQDAITKILHLPQFKLTEDQISSVHTDCIVINGIHQFTPIMLRTIEVLSKFANVFILFNYRSDYQNVYQTWLNVYSNFDSKINISSHNFASIESKLPGQQLADDIAGLVNGNTSSAIGSNPIEVTEFDNATEFAGYIAKEFEAAEERQKADGYSHPDTLYYMRDQIYAANSSVNDILKIYFPNQFGERQFLDYPIGHFFISITNMWDPETKQMDITDMNDLRECLCCGILKETYHGELEYIFNKTREFFSDVTTIDAVIKRLNRLKKVKKNDLEDEDSEYAKHLSFCTATNDEIDMLIHGLSDLEEITEDFYDDFNDERNDFRRFYDKVEEVLKTRILPDDTLNREFKDIVSRVLKRLDEVKNTHASASFDCLRETMQIYLQQNPVEGKGAKWIVRNFEQIDGDVLRKNSSDHEKVYHFACLSDEDMSITHLQEFPWPLDIHFFEYAQEPVDWKYQVFVTSRLEYKNFRRYALVYGLSFSHSNIKLSYIKHEDDNDCELYYLLRILNSNVVPYSQILNSRRLIPVEIAPIPDSQQKPYDKFDLMRYRLCPYRFIIESVVQGDTIYRDQFQMNTLAVIALENHACAHFEGKRFTEAALRGFLEDNAEELRKHFRYLLHSETMDIVNRSYKYLTKKYAKKGFPHLDNETKSFMIQRELFHASQTSNNEKEKNVFAEADQTAVNKALEPGALSGERFLPSVNSLCDRCAINGICLERYKYQKPSKKFLKGERN